ncbi:MAG: triose-phosphate isomerase [Defluviitaleaceae bacterium]|nr:triose-phosphate isomerase [Defluviitaleaceae bacterium]
MRKKVIAGNWKMNFTPTKAEEFAQEMKNKINTDAVDVVICVPYVNLQSVQKVFEGTHIKVGAQNMHYMDDGAYTGEISGLMLGDMGVPYVIIGHSERRERFGETDTTINLKTLKALEHGITPIICVGESQKQRKSGRTENVLRKQIAFALDELSASDVTKVVIAYEPIWAIGTGEVATSKQANEACAFIRGQIHKRFGDSAAACVRILYGGSVTDETANELFSMSDIDGGLIGGASVVPSFEKVVHFG